MSTLATRVDGPAPEAQVVRDIARRGLMVTPVVVGLGTLFWGLDGALSSAYAVLIVLANFLLAATLISTTAKISLGLMMGATLFGYLARLGLVFLAYLAVRNLDWFAKAPFGITLIVMHLGLLIWETKYVAATLAFPGLKPQSAHNSRTTP